MLDLVRVTARHVVFPTPWFAKSPRKVTNLGDNKARINSPGTIGDPNWCWKLRDMSWINKVKFGQ